MLFRTDDNIHLLEDSCKKNLLIDACNIVMII